ncbi:hypothetical protein Bhyg_13589, partial [Pseudolycoriella hygida]
MRVAVVLLLVLICGLASLEARPKHHKKGVIAQALDDICDFLKLHLGHGCDEMAENLILKEYRRARLGITDCHTYCRKQLNKNAGKCAPGGKLDFTFYCPVGTTCTC